jgi:hypothetical protein
MWVFSGFEVDTAKVSIFGETIKTTLSCFHTQGSLQIIRLMSLVYRSYMFALSPMLQMVFWKEIRCLFYSALEQFNLLSSLEFYHLSKNIKIVEETSSGTTLYNLYEIEMKEDFFHSTNIACSLCYTNTQHQISLVDTHLFIKGFFLSHK